MNKRSITGWRQVPPAALSLRKRSRAVAPSPIAVIIMPLLAVPLAFVNPRSGRSWNLILAVLVYALYNNLLSIFQAWTAQGKIPIWVGLWPVHFAMVAILFILFSRQLYGARWLAFGR